MPSTPLDHSRTQEAGPGSAQVLSPQSCLRTEEIFPVIHWKILAAWTSWCPSPGVGLHETNMLPQFQPSEVSLVVSFSRKSSWPFTQNNSLFQPIILSPNTIPSFVAWLIFWLIEHNPFPHYFVGPQKTGPYLLCLTAHPGPSMRPDLWLLSAHLSFLQVWTVPNSGWFDLTIFQLYGGAKACPFSHSCSLSVQYLINYMG